MILSEGAGAVVLARDGSLLLEKVHPGGSFAQQNKLAGQLEAICEQLRDNGEMDVMLASANGTFVDAAEMAAAQKYFSGAAIYTPKPALGEGVAAGTMWQFICAALALRRQELPPLLHAPKSCLTIASAPTEKPWQCAIVTACGLNQQVAGCVLRT
jgi:3-oxoacyl-(acyl-carrier-protein) synthase